MTYGNAKIKSKYKMKEGDGKVSDIKHDDEVEKDLGVLFDTKLSFRQHIGCTVKKVNRMIGLRRRTFHYTVVPALGDPRRERPPALYGHVINATTDTLQR